MKNGRATLTTFGFMLRSDAVSAAAAATVALAIGSTSIFRANTNSAALVWMSAAVGISSILFAIGATREDRKMRWLLMSAPLYGRELARAIVIAPVLIGCLAGSVTSIIGMQLVPWYQCVIATLAAAATGNMISISGTLRIGRDRLVFLASGFVAASGIAYIGTLGGPMTTAASVLLAAVGSYFALRAFGETFARLDLVD